MSLVAPIKSTVVALRATCRGNSGMILAGAQMLPGGQLVEVRAQTSDLKNTEAGEDGGDNGKR